MTVSAEPEVLSFREKLEETQEFRRQADGIESQIRTELKELFYKQVVMQPLDTDETRREVERFGGFGGSVQLRKFGETGGWSMAHSQLRPVPAAGRLVGVEVEHGAAYAIIAETHFHCEWRFNLRHFSMRLVEDSD